MSRLCVHLLARINPGSFQSDHGVFAALIAVLIVIDGCAGAKAG
jgi:hypothetical protein